MNENSVIIVKIDLSKTENLSKLANKLNPPPLPPAKHTSPRCFFQADSTRHSRRLVFYKLFQD